ncbi:E3 ubiquitin-protein ligase RFI2-like [Malania oleifera]|uniref:E3 ubiquitin-protein ligase RFI2-like n=1 Tax=Malania oleifera TaxID=397392 RepID=UPI0025ADC5D2|nr:E3 ubiquitin-protein ligase RFI2-like [Malania oleifera]
MAQHAGGAFSSSVTCSVCLEEVTVESRRSTATLRCGHWFHLDCIGSVFNVRGSMQCPNCRDVENGEWRFADGGSAESAWSDDDLRHFIRMQLSGPHWCPHLVLLQVLGSFVERGFSLLDYYEDPAISYGGPNDHYWAGRSVPSGHPTSHILHLIEHHHYSIEHHFQAISNHLRDPSHASVPTATHGFGTDGSDHIPSMESFAHPVILDQGYGAGPRSTPISSINSPFPGSNIPVHDRIPAMWQQPSSNSPSPVVRASMLSRTRGSNGPRVFPDQVESFYSFPSSSLSEQNVQQAAALPVNAPHRTWDSSEIQRHLWQSNEIAASELSMGSRARQSGWPSFP